jgi:hypothetical protein
MNPPHTRQLRFLLICAAAFAVASAGTATAQKAPPVPPNPQAPTLKQPFPMGMQRGTTLELTLTGANLAEPTGLWTSFPAKVTIPTENNNGKDNAKLVVRLEVPMEAPMGFHAIGLATTRGMSNYRLFCIDDLPEVLQGTNNRTKDAAQAVRAPCVVAGRVTAEANDYYKVTVKAGERVSFEVLGRRLGSAFDPQLTLIDPKTGREMPGGHSNDAPGLQTDPRLTYTFKDAGDYLLEIRDVSYRGGEDFIYRLRIGDFPCATTPLPLAIKRGTKVAVRFAGPTVDGVAAVEVTAPTDPLIPSLSVTPKGANGLHGWPVSLLLSDLDEVLEEEPNDELPKANRVPVPGAVTGRFEKKDDVDFYIFTLKKGQRYSLEAQTQELHSPTEVDMVLLDAKGAQLQASNLQGPARLDFTPQADGDYILKMKHLLLWGGPAETYRVTITPYEPGFDLSIGIDRYDVGQGSTFSIPLFVARRDYPGPIDVTVVGNPKLSGHATIAAGQPPMPNQPGGTLTIAAAADAPMGPQEFAIQAKATIKGKEVSQLLSVRALASQNLAGLPVPPRAMYERLGLAVKERPPFTLAFKFDEPTGTPGKPLGLTVTATRTAGFTEEITLTAAGLPPNVKPALVNIAANQTEAKMTLNLEANAPLGQFMLTLTGKAKYKNQDVTINSPPLQLAIKKLDPALISAAASTVGLLGSPTEQCPYVAASVVFIFAKPKK